MSRVVAAVTGYQLVVWVIIGVHRPLWARVSEASQAGAVKGEDAQQNGGGRVRARAIASRRSWRVSVWFIDMFHQWARRLTQRVAREKTVRLQFEDTVKLPPPVRADFRLLAALLSPFAC